MRVLYFAQAAEAAGCREENWEGWARCSQEEFWNEAIARHPELAAWQERCRLAVDGVYRTAGEVIAPRVEIAVLPPVSGG